MKDDNGYRYGGGKNGQHKHKDEKQRLVWITKIASAHDEIARLRRTQEPGRDALIRKEERTIKHLQVCCTTRARITA